MAELIEKYSKTKYGRPFLNLTAFQKNQIYLEIIDSSSRSRPSVNAAALKYTRLGRGLLVVTVGVAVYNIAVAEDKVKATAREGVIIGGGFVGGAAGGAAGGALAGAWCASLCNCRCVCWWCLRCSWY